MRFGPLLLLSINLNSSMISGLCFFSIAYWNLCDLVILSWGQLRVLLNYWNYHYWIFHHWDHRTILQLFKFCWINNLCKTIMINSQADYFWIFGRTLTWNPEKILVENDGLVISASTFFFCKLLYFLLKQNVLILIEWYIDFGHK